MVEGVPFNPDPVRKRLVDVSNPQISWAIVPCDVAVALFLSAQTRKIKRKDATEKSWRSRKIRSSQECKAGRRCGHRWIFQAWVDKRPSFIASAGCREAWPPAHQAIRWNSCLTDRRIHALNARAYKTTGLVGSTDRLTGQRVSLIWQTSQREMDRRRNWSVDYSSPVRSDRFGGSLPQLHPPSLLYHGISK